MRYVADEELAKLYEGYTAGFPENCHIECKDGTLLKLKGKKLVPVANKKVWGISFRHNFEQAFAVDDILDPDIKLIAITGHAGTGKTFIALLGALNVIGVDVLYTREIEHVGKDFGILRGTLDDKFSPFTRPMADNMEIIEHYAGRTFEHRIDTYPLQFMRGATLNNTYLIVDEAQNCSKETLKMAISRAGKGSKVILCGSFNQIDTKGFNQEENGLATVIDRFGGQELFSHVHLIKDERSELARLADELL